MNQSILAADIGGTHITAALVDLRSQAIVSGTLTRRVVDAGASVPDIIATWSSAMLEAGGEYKPTRVGIAMPGPFDYANGISLMRNQGKYDALYGINVKELLATALQLDAQYLKFQNDAPCFLLGEAFAGAAKGYHKAIGLTLGTGLGSTVLANGKAWDADLWKLPFQGGIAEEYLSSRWFVRRFYELSGVEVAGVKELVDLLPTEPNVQALFAEFSDNLATFLSGFVQQEQPEVIVLGGNISKAFHLFGARLQDNLRAQHGAIPVEVAQLGESAALLGAASLWQEANQV